MQADRKHTFRMVGIQMEQLKVHYIEYAIVDCIPSKMCKENSIFNKIENNLSLLSRGKGGQVE